MLCLDGALLDHEDSGGGGDVAKGDEHKKRREGCEDELDCELLGTRQREWVVVHRIALLRGRRARCRRGRRAVNLAPTRRGHLCEIRGERVPRRRVVKDG